MKLYDYFRSTASYRVRIALALKNVHFDKLPIHLVKGGGEQFNDDYKKVNPASLVPSLSGDFGIITQSLAIIDYLEDEFPRPSIYPKEPNLKYWVKSIALTIACDIHPLNNLRVLKYLQETLNISDPQKIDWYHHWILQGFSAIETELAKVKRDKPFCIGEHPTIADICLIPQVYNANRFGVQLENFPLICKINEYCLSLEPFNEAKPKA